MGYEWIQGSAPCNKREYIIQPKRKKIHFVVNLFIFCCHQGNRSFQLSVGNVHNVSIPALSIRDPECHGYLSKQGQSKLKTWKRRYCVLKNGYLYYYTDMSNATALGVAKLLGYSLEKGEQHGKRCYFRALPPEDSLRMYFFAADSERERERQVLGKTSYQCSQLLPCGFL